MLAHERATLDAAIKVATEAHYGQADKGGLPYILHPLRVMLAVKDHGPAAMAVAVLHDVLEDTSVTTVDLARTRGAGGLAFSAGIIEAVESVSRRKGETYTAFIERAAENRLGAIVKRADILDNLREPFPFGPSMLHRYRKALLILPV